MNVAGERREPVDDRQLLETSVALIEDAARRGIVLRLIGALGVRVACPRGHDLLERLGRRTDDVDLAGLGKQWTPIVELFEERGYDFDERRALTHGSGRLIFSHQTGFRVDVFLDRLRMCHEIDMRESLQRYDGLALPAADLALQKLQIVELTRKDVIDLIVLLREHDFSREERIARLLADDWGFYHTAAQNLEHLREESLAEFAELSDGDRRLVSDRVDELMRRIEGEPKTLRWKVRAKVGPRTRWYQEVDELER